MEWRELKKELLTKEEFENLEKSFYITQIKAMFEMEQYKTKETNTDLANRFGITKKQLNTLLYKNKLDLNNKELSELVYKFGYKIILKKVDY